MMYFFNPQMEYHRNHHKRVTRPFNILATSFRLFKSKRYSGPTKTHINLPHTNNTGPFRHTFMMSFHCYMKGCYATIHVYASPYCLFWIRSLQFLCFKSLLCFGALGRAVYDAQFEIVEQRDFCHDPASCLYL